jgi:TPP-dependent trihydroxycyclohexane-1,2-dione (THcHDO) dehydratase
METVRLTVGQAIVRFMARQSVEREWPLDRRLAARFHLRRRLMPVLSGTGW